MARPVITSRTQYEVLRLFARGKSEREITDLTTLEGRAVTRTINEFCARSTSMAADLVADYEHRASAVAAARGTTPGQPTPPAPAAAVDPVAQLLAAAAASPNRRLQALGDKVRILLGDLRAAVTREEQAAEAQRRVDELAAELEKAREALRAAQGKPAQPAESAPTGSAAPAKTVRAWARENGIEVPALGRIPGDVMAAYLNQQEGEQP